MSFFYPELEISRRKRNGPKHPWENIIKAAYAGTYKYGHNSAKNPVYPPPKKGKVPSKNRMKFTVIGIRTAKEFIYCMNLVKGLHKYRWRYFDAPIIKAVTSVEWPTSWRDLKIKYGGEAFCLEAEVAVLLNDQFLGGEKELKELIESKYIYYIRPDYFTEAVHLFTDYIKSTGRPCAYFEINIDETYIGMLIFMLYSDLVPSTCENFLRLCKERKGGYSGTPVHRVVQDGWIQCGGFGLKQSQLCCENFVVPHDRRGVLGMCNDGRHVDCSTQFFVLLQPQDWMASKYVAFGQLISGDQVLKKIEKVPVFYESPKKNIIISKAGILNMECQDIIINKGANKYIEGHHENLITIGEIFYEELLQKVFLEVQFRSLQRIQDEMIAEVESEITPEEVAKNLRTTARFMRKKEEIDKQIEKSEGDRSGKTTPAPAVEKGENNDFDVEEYEYQPEEYSYTQVTAVVSGSLVVKPEKPYFIPLTDVPFPGEVSSEYNLKRLLQGDYCLEADLDLEAVIKKKKTAIEKSMFRPKVLAAIREKQSQESESSILYESSLDSLDDIQYDAIKKYKEENADRVSYSGTIIKKVAERGKQNILDLYKASDVQIVDEALRKYRLAEIELKRGHDKRVSIATPEESKGKTEIIRRPTGFVRPEDLARIRLFERADEDISDDSEIDDYLPYTRQVSIQPPNSVKKNKNLEIQHQKPTGARTEEQEIKKVAEDAIGSNDSLLFDETEQDFEKSHVVGWKPNMPSYLRVNKGDTDEDLRISRVSRQSRLSRIVDEVDTDVGPVPTLRRFQPPSEQIQKMNESRYLLTYTPDKYKDLSDDSREPYLWRRHPVNMSSAFPLEKSFDQLLLMQHGKKVYRKISTDYVKTIDRIEQKEQTSLRSLEYAKKRPAMSIKEYKQKNKEYQEDLARRSKLCSNKVSSATIGEENLAKR